jgi:hypothetical protein
MTRGLQETLKDNLSQRSKKVVDLVKITASDGGRLKSAVTGLRIDNDLYFTNNEYDLTYDSITYKADYGFIGHSDIQESSSAVNDQFELLFTGIDPTLTGDILNSKFVGAKAQVYKAVMIGSGADLDVHVDSASINERVYKIFDGTINSFNYTLGKESGTLSLQCGSIFAAFEKKSLYGFTTSTSHQVKYPADQSMKFAQIDLTGLKWGLD